MKFLPPAVRGASGYDSAPVAVAGSTEIEGVLVRRVVAPQFAQQERTDYQDPGDAFVIAFVSSGGLETYVSHRTEPTVVGQMAINDMSRVSGFQVSPDFRSMSVRIKKTDLGIPDADVETLSRNIVTYNSGVPLVLCAVATQVLRTEHPFTQGTGLVVAKSMIDLATAFVNEALGRSSEPQLVRRNVVSEAKRHIDTHLTEQTLTPATIAEALHISLRSLHLAFESESASVARTILSRRLERCREALEQPGLRHLSIEMIAGRWGFSNASHFSRAFRAMYGCSPRDWRVENGRFGTSISA